MKSIGVLCAPGWSIFFVYVVFALLSVYVPSVIFFEDGYKVLLADYLSSNYSDEYLRILNILSALVVIFLIFSFLKGFNGKRNGLIKQSFGVLLYLSSCIGGCLLILVVTLALLGEYWFIVELVCFIFSIVFFYVCLKRSMILREQPNLRAIFIGFIFFVFCIVSFSLVLDSFYFDAVFYVHGEIIDNALKTNSGYIHPASRVISIFPSYYEVSRLYIFSVVSLAGYVVGHVLARQSLKKLS